MNEFDLYGSHTNCVGFVSHDVESSTVIMDLEAHDRWAVFEQDRCDGCGEHRALYAFIYSDDLNSNTEYVCQECAVVAVNSIDWPGKWSRPDEPVAFIPGGRHKAGRPLHPSERN